MSTESYPIIEIQPAWVLEDEQMGSKTKFWYRPDGDDGDWLFKYPKPNTGLHWSEKIAAEIADLMKVRHARVELALFDGQRGSITESFARDGRNLFHGNQVLAGCVLGYNTEATFRHSSHTLANIWLALEKAFVTDDARNRAKRFFAKCLVLDALIGNVDRHHENWGLLRKRVKDRWKGFLAPSFDHASSLGRELLDERRSLLLRERRVGRYSEGGHGGIYWSSDEKRGPSPLELVRRALVVDPDSMLHGLEALKPVTRSALEGIIARVPDDWMTATARAFTLELLFYNLEQLHRLIP